MYLNCQNASFCSDPLFINDSRTAPDIDKIEKKNTTFKQTLKGTKMQLHSHKKAVWRCCFHILKRWCQNNKKKWGKINKRKNPRLHLTRQSLGFLSKNDNPYRNLVSAFFFGCNNSCKLDTPWRHSSMWQHVKVISFVEFFFNSGGLGPNYTKS